MSNPLHELLPHLFRQEYAKITAVLCRYFGLPHIEIAEDIASDTFLKASEHWAVNGLPENPTAWLYAVAKNKARDHLRRTGIFETKVKQEITPDIAIAEKIEFNESIITDSQLAMIFAVCNPANAAEGQICLALQILCGFNVDEIAGALLTKGETIKKRLHRARTKLRNNRFQIEPLSETEIQSRLATVLQTLYLLFNEGYYSRTSSRQVRVELCSEATRLTLLLIENPLTNTPQVNALLALMCFQSSRLEARIKAHGPAILFDEQDRTLWDESLIQRGNFYLVNATTGNEVSKYHLEAAIAYWHTTTGDDSKWTHILHLYDQLLMMVYSPVTALNRGFAFSKVYGCEQAIIELEKLQFTDNNYYYQLLGYLYAETDPQKAICHYEIAIGMTKSKVEKQTLNRQVERLHANSVSF